jgi:rhamnose utilization protein RhaD (predicted bifunctional aldolase and dehydrogenase)/NAD(P)-dependent dehydrogenase (short-subunit alcohol dehydrogenase family)
MHNRWSDAEAKAIVERYRERCNADVALRVYTSRLIGQESALVLHGGGNTSVKTVVADDTGKDTEVLCVKGSGWDLGAIEPEGLPAVRLEPLRALRHLDALSDEDMVNAQRSRMLDTRGPNPSVETLLHAFLPHKFIDHSHADAILSMVDQPEAERLCRELYGDSLAIVPYVMPGFALAKLAAEVHEQHPDAEGLLLLRHGLFTFGDSAEQAYTRHIDAVTKAEEACHKKRYWAKRDQPPKVPPVSYAELAPVLRGCLGSEGRCYVLHLRTSDEITHFVDDADVARLSQIGCATPDHVIRTKRFPLVLDLDQKPGPQGLRAFVDAKVSAYREEYRAYVERQMTSKGFVVTPLDPEPRVVLIPGIGMVTVGASDKAARIAADIYEHTIEVIRNAEAIGRYEVLAESDLFDMEYWSLEQAKLGKSKPKPLQSQVVYVTGAARGIGAAVAERFAKAGATLYLVDKDGEALEKLATKLGAVHEVLDVTNEGAVRASVRHVVERHGGIDGIVSNAGAAPQSAIDLLSTDDLEASLRINLFAHQWVASSAAVVMRAQGTGGFLLFNASKSAFNPGADFGPYAIPKAALIALMKQYALEMGPLGVRANAINADRIRTGLLDEKQLAERARARGLEPDDYYRANLLGREVTAGDVADAFLSLALAKSTTGAVLTVDGGNIAASPR